MVSESTTNISHILITAVPKQKYAETLLQKTRTPRKWFFFNSKNQSHVIQT